MKKPIIWYLIADGARARIVHRQEFASGYETELELESAEARRPSRAIASDRPGRVGESASPTRHAMEPRQDPHEAAKKAFMREVAEAIAPFEGRFDRLVLVAPARVLGELRSALPAGVRAKVTEEIAKDLTNTPIGELGEHLPKLGRLPE
ncbi:MAG: host attachment protein [Rhodospirillales bacterium]|nr:host attachment protein [Rhodospirillales bacterium]